MSQRSSSPESDFAKPGDITIECISNAGHSIIGHKSMGTYPACAIIRYHTDICPSSPTESNNVSSDGIFLCPSVVRIMGIFYHTKIRQAFDRGVANYINKVIKRLQGLVCRPSYMQRLNQPLLINTNIFRDEADVWYFEAVV